MKLEDQVVSVELSNKLLELGVRKPSLFYREWTGAKSHEIEMWEDRNGDVCLDNVNCYTVAELGEMMPRGFDTQKGEVNYHIKFSTEHWAEHWNSKWLHNGTNDRHLHGLTTARTEADARAKMLIYLLENDLLKT